MDYTFMESQSRTRLSDFQFTSLHFTSSFIDSGVLLSTELISLFVSMFTTSSSVSGKSRGPLSVC